VLAKVARTLSLLVVVVPEISADKPATIALQERVAAGQSGHEIVER
jgi:hypothetical protein